MPARDDGWNSPDSWLDSEQYLLGIAREVNASSDFGDRDLWGLRLLADFAGKRFARGLLLHTGRLVEPVGPRLVAAPIASLWQ